MDKTKAFLFSLLIILLIGGLPNFVLADAPIDKNLVNMINEYIEKKGEDGKYKYYNENWNISPSQYKAWIALITMRESGLGGYAAHSQMSCGKEGDRFHHKDRGDAFRFSTGIGAFQLDRGGEEGAQDWGAMSTYEKLDPKVSLESVLEWHYIRFENWNGATLKDFWDHTNYIWFALKCTPGKDIDCEHEEDYVRFDWGFVAPVSNWDVIKSTRVDVNFDPLTEEKPFEDDVRYVGKAYWYLWNGYFDTWLITARNWSGVRVTQYYYASNEKLGYEIWIDNDEDETFIFEFSRRYNKGPFPEGRKSKLCPEYSLAGTTHPSKLLLIPQPNLKPYQPWGWSDRIVVSNSKNTNIDSFLFYTTDTLYVDWAVINDGPVATPQGFSVALYIDGVLKKTWSLKACLNPNGYWPIDDYSIGKLSAGVHTLRIVANSSGVIQETNKEDNEYTKTITVQCALTLTTKINPLGAGTVTKNPDKNTYCSDETVTLTATPNAGFSFKSWSGVDSSDSTTATVTMKKNRSVTAKFVTYTLKVTISSAGSGTVTRNPGKSNYSSGEVVTLTATPNPGFSFKSWRGVDSSDGTTATVTMNKNRTVTAKFVKATETVSTVTITPSSWTFTSPGTKQLTATAKYSDNSTQDVTNKASWASSNPNIASVSNSGLISSGQNGSAIITATYGDTNGTCSVTVNVELSENYTVKSGAETDSTEFSCQRKLAITSYGNLHVVYHRKDSSAILQIYHAESADGGQTWTEEQLTNATIDQSLPALAVDSRDNLHLVWQHDTTAPGTIPTTYYRKKMTTWQPAEFVASYATTPAIAIDGNDDVHVVYGVYIYPPGYWGGGDGIRWRKRTSSGWQPEERVSLNQYWVRFPAIAIDWNNNVHVAWSNSPRPDYFDTHYRERTSSAWGPEDEINTETNNESGGIPSIAIDANNYVHVVWEHFSGGYSTIKYRKRTTSWQPPQDLEGPTSYNQSDPTIALDSKNHIHVVWTGQHSASPTYYQIRYEEYTTSWQPIENLTSSTSNDQINPNLMWAPYPTVNGVKTNQPEDGCAFVWVDGTTIEYSGTVP